MQQRFVELQDRIVQEIQKFVREGQRVAPVLMCLSFDGSLEATFEVRVPPRLWLPIFRALILRTKAYAILFHCEATIAPRGVIDEAVSIAQHGGSINGMEGTFPAVTSRLETRDGETRLVWFERKSDNECGELVVLDGEDLGPLSGLREIFPKREPVGEA